MAKMKKRKKARRPEDELGEEYEGLVVANGFTDAIIGVTASQPGRRPCVVYDYEMCVNILVMRDRMEYEEAVEHMNFNVTGAWVGEGTPIFIFSRFPHSHI